MKNRRMLILALFSIALVFILIVAAWAAGTSVTVPQPDGHPISHLAVDSSSPTSAMALNTPQANVMPMIAAGESHSVGLRSDATVVAASWSGEIARWDLF